MTREELLSQGILISEFAFRLDGKWAFRFYWKDLHKDYCHNPLTVLDNGKRTYPFFYEHSEGLAMAIRTATQYLENRRSL